MPPSGTGESGSAFFTTVSGGEPEAEVDGASARAGAFMPQRGKNNIIECLRTITPRSFCGERPTALTVPRGARSRSATGNGRSAGGRCERPFAVACDREATRGGRRRRRERDCCVKSGG